MLTHTFHDEYFLPIIYLNRGRSSTSDANAHAPGSPKQTAANAAVEAEESIAPPLTICGRKAQISRLHSTTPNPLKYKENR